MRKLTKEFARLKPLFHPHVSTKPKPDSISAPLPQDTINRVPLTYALCQHSVAISARQIAYKHHGIQRRSLIEEVLVRGACDVCVLDFLQDMIERQLRWEEGRQEEEKEYEEIQGIAGEEEEEWAKELTKARVEVAAWIGFNFGNG